MKAISFLFFIATGVTLFLTACRKEEPVKPDSCFVPDYSDTVQYDLYRDWTFLGFVNTDQTETCAPDGIPSYGMYLYAVPPGANAGYYYAECNDGYIMDLEVKGDSIRMEEIWGTLLYCPENFDFETWFTNGLWDARTYTIDHDILSLKTTRGAVLKFRAKK